MSPERRREIARDIITLLGRIDWLVYALLKMSRLDAGTLRNEGGDSIRNKSSDRAGISTGGGFHGSAGYPLEMSCGARLQLFQGDLSWSVEAVGNILKTCMEYSEPGGAITVEGTENPLYTELMIRDEGKGIAPEDLPHLFERFYRGKHNSTESVGIGLSLAQKIITQQNGTIQVKNGTKRGAVFTIRFYKSVI